MRIQSKKSNRKKVFTAVILIAVFLGMGVGAYFILNNNTKNKDGDTNLSQPSKEQIDAGNKSKDETLNTPAPENNPKTNENNTPSSSSGPAITITAANQNGSIVQIRTLINALTDSGTCTLTMSQGETVLTRSAGVQALASNSSCKGFDIPTSDLGSTGEWNITVSFSENNSTSQATKKIIIN